MQRDLANYIVPKNGISPVAIAGDGDTVSAVVDVKLFNSAIAVLQVGAVTTGDVIISLIEESADQAFTVPVVIPATRIWGTAVALDTANTTDYVGFDAELPFVRVTMTGANTAALLASVAIIGGNEVVKDYRKLPASS